MVMEIYVPIYKKHLAFDDDLKGVISFYESPLGQRYTESAMGIMREAMPLLVSRLQMDMRKELHELDRRAEVMDQTRNRDQEIYDAAYALPKDSIEVANRPYNRAGGNKAFIIFH